MGFTSFPDTVANENLDKGKVAGPTAGRCDCDEDEDEDWGDMKLSRGTYQMRNERDHQSTDSTLVRERWNCLHSKRKKHSRSRAKLLL